MRVLKVVFLRSKHLRKPLTTKIPDTITLERERKSLRKLGLKTGGSTQQQCAHHIIKISPCCSFVNILDQLEKCKTTTIYTPYRYELCFTASVRLVLYTVILEQALCTLLDRNMQLT